MTFEEILDQAIAMLQRRKRVAYRTLQVQFHLDDNALEALKDELLYAQQVARDEDGRVLVWMSSAETLPFPPPSSAQHAPQPALQETTQTASPPAAPTTADAERRQLTVMFCDLVDSTKLSSQLDPEEYRDVVRAYQRVCTDVIQRYDGHIAQLLGDGLLIYFGYPQAHEDDAQRAVRTGLGILATMGDLNQGLQQAKGIQLGVRLGIHTGLVVVGEMGGEGRYESLALGAVPNACSRIQGLAAPNTIAISEATYRLVQGYFECQDLGAQPLRGVAEPVHVYRVLQDSGAQSRLDIASTRGLTPLVGREQEVGLLLERWNQVKEGQGQVILLSGDAGIGKSRLVQVLKERVTSEPAVQLECRSLPYYQNTALYPIVDLLQRLLPWQPNDAPEEKLATLARELSQYRLSVEESVQLFAPLLSLPVPEQAYPPLHLSPQRQRQRTLEALMAILLEQAERHPVLLIVEDLHWTDPTTLEFLNLLIEQIPTTSILTVLTCRPTFQPSWSHRSYLSEVTVHRLSQPQIERMTTQVAGGKLLPPQVLAQIVEKTDGVPLFVEEITKSLLESGQLRAVDGHYELTGSFATFAIPATLQDSLMARLDRLITDKVIAQLGAAIGRQFSYALLQAVAQLNERTLHEELHRLVEAELLYQRGLPPQATYVFKHALIQDAAYQSLLKSTRQQYHQRIAQVLEEQFPETAETQPELLAHHYTEAGLNEPAVDYWQQAGQHAIERSANVEASRHLTRGLEVLATLPDTPERHRQEFVLQTTLGPVLMAIRGQGAPEVERAYARARELCQHVGETPQLFPVLWGLWYFYLARAEWRVARELGEQLLSLAQHTQDPTLLLLAHRVLGQTLSFLGEFASARSHLAQALTFYDPQQHHPLAFLYGQDQGVICHSWAALVLWLLGYPDQARQRSYEMLILAQELHHPHSLTYALYWAAMLDLYHREGQAAQERVEAGMVLSHEQGFALWIAWGTLLRGCALAEQGQSAEGILQMRQGIAAWRATGAEVFRPYSLALLAEAYGKAGQAEEGVPLLAEALAAVDNTGERYYEAELYRLKGELLLAQVGKEPRWLEAEESFRQALAVARQQQAKSLELRAAMSLARLLLRLGKRTEAHQLLAGIYGWFTEGFDTADLQEAKALLEALA